MANLVIDIGNTQTKIGVFEGDHFVVATQHQKPGEVFFTTLVERYGITQAIISSVLQEQQAWETMLAGTIKVSYFNNTMATGLTNHYLTPLTLGADRVAAVYGALKLYPAQNSLVIDGGTAITYDFVNAGGNYFGGSISPGLKTRYKALNYYTASLPEVEADKNFAEQYGNSTLTAIQSGVQNGLKYELEGFINAYQAQYEQLNILLTGGDGEFFDTLLKNSIFAPYVKIEHNLVLTGLNAALLQNND